MILFLSCQVFLDTFCCFFGKNFLYYLLGGKSMKNLILLREKKGLRQEDMAKKLEVSRQAYCTYENDRHQASYETLIKLADFFDVSIDYLLGREERQTPVFQRKTEIQALFDELSDYDKRMVLSFVKTAIKEAGKNVDLIISRDCG